MKRKKVLIGKRVDPHYVLEVDGRAGVDAEVNWSVVKTSHTFKCCVLLCSPNLG